MPWVLVRHRIDDYQKWRPIFDGAGALLERSGARSGFVFRNLEAPDELFVLLEWPVLDAARDFMASAALRKEMARAGVAEPPHVWYLDELEPPALTGR